jgi:cell division protein FtsN
MARDYKYRSANTSLKRSRYGSGSHRNNSLVIWKWMLITAFIIGFVVFIFYIGSKKDQPATSMTTALDAMPSQSEQKDGQQQPEAQAEADGPEFKFYSILTDQEAVVPEHEIDTRSREERVGQAKKTQYHLQAGSFKDFDEADQLRAKLASMGIDARIERAKINNVTWHRIKMGPYTRISSVNTILSRLKSMGVDVLVIENEHTAEPG